MATEVHSQASEKPTELDATDNWVTWGLGLVVLALYLLTCPGRIDIIDGQFRVEVARSMLDLKGVQIQELALSPTIPGTGGERYSFYGPGGSITGLPLMALARLLGANWNGEMFAFSLTSAFAISFCIALFYRFRRRLGDARRPALQWSLVLAAATPMWYLATTVFDQGQHATLLFVALYLAWRSLQENSIRLAASGGLIAGSTVLFQESLLLLAPCIAIACLSSAPTLAECRRPSASVKRYIAFGLAATAPLLIWMAYNQARFGAPLFSGRSGIVGHPPLWGSLPSGLLGLLFSPGKSIFLYAPTVLLSLFALRRFARAHRTLGVAIIATCVVQLLFTSSLTFWGSDWAWGSRYLALLMPLLALPLGLREPADSDPSALRKVLTGILIAAAVLVQVLSVSVDHQRFFFENNYRPHFWYTTPSVYWKNSQLLARPGELKAVLTEPLPDWLAGFSPGPNMRYPPTYAMYGPPRNVPGEEWVRRFAVFHFPRPWLGWIGVLPPARQPVSPSHMLLAIALLLGAGGVALGRGLGKPADSASPEP